MKKREETGSGAALVRTAVLGGGAAIGMVLVLAAVCAAAILAGILPEGRLRAAAVAVTFLAVFCGCLWAARTAGQKRLFLALGAAAVYVLAAYLGKTAFHLSGKEGTVSILLAVAAGTLCAGLLSSRKQSKRRRG